MKPFTVSTAAGQVAVHLKARTKGGPLWYRYWLKGKAFCRSAKTADVLEAQRAARLDVLRESQALASGVGAASVAELVQLYLEARWPEEDPAIGRPDVRKNNRTYQDHLMRLKIAAAGIAAPPLASLPEGEVSRAFQRHLSARRTTKSAQTVINDQRVLQAFCKWLMQQGVPWAWNPAGTERLTLDRVDRSPGYIPSDADVALLLGLLEAWRHRLYPVAVLVLSGMRRSGACRVRWSWIGQDRWIWPTKEKRAKRWVPLSSWAYDRLAWWKGIAPPEGTDAKLWPYHTDTSSDDMNKLRDQLAPFKDRDGRALWPAGLDLAALRRHAQDRVDRARLDERSRSFLMNHSPAVAEAHYRAKGGGPEALAAANEVFNYGA